MTLSGYGPPTDPSYVRFEAGLKEVAAKIDTLKRWHGRAEEWRPFDSVNWIIDESYGLADTSPAAVLSGQKWNPPRYDVIGNVPALFADIRAAQKSILERNPKLEHPVWTPWEGGDWRIAVPRSQASSGPTPPTGLPDEARRRIKIIEDEVRAGKISVGRGDELIAEIYRDWAVGRPPG